MLSCTVKVFGDSVAHFKVLHLTQIYWFFYMVLAIPASFMLCSNMGALNNGGIIKMIRELQNDAKTAMDQRH